MKSINWNQEKNRHLIVERGISFEVVVSYIEKEEIIDIVDHPNRKQYADQKIFVIAIEDYVYMVPFVETENELFLKTIIPSRKATRDYLGR